MRIDELTFRRNGRGSGISWYLQLAKRKGAGNESEGITSAQLLLLLRDAQQQAQALQQANDKLGAASQPPTKPALAPAPKAPRQPPAWRPPPPNLRRVDNPIAVPDEERPCPICGKLRKCIGQDFTEVIGLVPAEVIVRVDRREVLSCEPRDAKVAEQSATIAEHFGNIARGGANRAKLYPDRYPFNADSIGIELVGSCVSADARRAVASSYPRLPGSVPAREPTPRVRTDGERWKALRIA